MPACLIAAALLHASFELHQSAATWRVSTAMEVHRSGRDFLDFAMHIAIYLAAKIYACFS